MFRRNSASLVLSLSLMLTAFTAVADDKDDQVKAAERVDRARGVYEELVKSPDRGVPEALLKNCRGIAIFPNVIKGAVGFGARYGKGVVVTRGGNGSWSPPAFFTLTGGSWGLQIGAESADIVVFFMSEKSVSSLLKSKFALSGKAGLSAGPVGRTAEAGTDLKLNSEMYSYARSRGLFAGISLEGARIASSTETNGEFYGAPITARQILVEHKVPNVPIEGERLRGVLP